MAIIISHWNCSCGYALQVIAALLLLRAFRFYLAAFLLMIDL
jgi:hypothetical protein